MSDTIDSSYRTPGEDRLSPNVGTAALPRSREASPISSSSPKLELSDLSTPFVSPLSFDTPLTADSNQAPAAHQGKSSAKPLNGNSWTVEPAKGALGDKIVSVNSTSPSQQATLSPGHENAASSGTDLALTRSREAIRVAQAQRVIEEYEARAKATGEPLPSEADESATTSRPEPERQKSSSSSSFGLGHRRKQSGSGGGVLKRLTSATSGITLDRSVSKTSREGEAESPLREEKSRKYKSGVNLNSANFQGQYFADEPFMEASSKRALDEEAQKRDAELAELQEMAAAGGTKAALARAKLNSIGNPYFPTTQLAAEEVSHENAMAERQNLKLEQRRRANQALGAPKQTSVDSAAPMSVQHALDSARQAAAEADEVLAQDSMAAADNSTGKLSTSPAAKSNGAAATAKGAKRRTFLGGLVGRGKKDGKAGASAAIPEGGESDAEKAASANVSGAATPAKDSSDSGTRTPTSGGARRRRFVDTRELEHVASQVALEQPEPAGGQAPASMMGVLASSSDPARAGPSTQAAGMSSTASLGMPQASFMNNGRVYSSGTTSPASGSPHASGIDLTRLDAMPGRPYARSTGSGSSRSSPQVGTMDRMTGLPFDMLTGLGDGPYPTLPTRLMDLTEGNRMGSGDSPYDGVRANGGRTSASSSLYRGRLPSNGSAGQPSVGSALAFSSISGNAQSASGTTSPPVRRSVLQMSMHDPESEAQGLTKGKSGKTTPFSSRAPSRNASTVALNEKIKDEASTKKGKPAEEGSPRIGGTGKPAKSGLFGRFNRSNQNVNQVDTKEPVPPLPTATRSSASPPVSAQASAPAAGSSAASATQPLQKVPSPGDLSSSSQDHSGLSSDASAPRQPHSSVTTPEISSTSVSDPASTGAMPLKGLVESVDSTSPRTVPAGPRQPRVASTKSDAPSSSTKTITPASEAKSQKTAPAQVKPTSNPPSKEKQSPQRPGRMSRLVSRFSSANQEKKSASSEKPPSVPPPPSKKPSVPKLAANGWTVQPEGGAKQGQKKSNGISA